MSTCTSSRSRNERLCRSSTPLVPLSPRQCTAYRRAYLKYPFDIDTVQSVYTSPLVQLTLTKRYIKYLQYLKIISPEILWLITGVCPQHLKCI